ncbi:purine-nucleoside phosphorylase [Metamycoplasma alkalescens]|uniref:Uridine phosphorylase n=1 Tax=Metamycoplasma alkalescens TaxID=45363 RepID=A0A318U5L7_9BACT|nr:purine-nucleoside phosphorylase [Metamycoplasma alkalescens]PYF43688.1 purine-nucleoside phosphorylase [Metamycoplasma alkalescens]SYV90685.1 purine nucleoside phosphorylase [Metamycoplasma alkalescens]
MTPHINAKENAFAKLVLMPGDPLRAKYIADTYLENVELVSSVRNVFMYTGYYQGNKISVCASGMGVPSIGIYSYELFSEYGVEAIVRIGSAGSLKADLKNREMVLASSAYSQSTSFRNEIIKNAKDEHVAYPNKELNDLIIKNAKDLNMHVHLDKILTEDAFYTFQTPEEREKISDGAVCVEMEAYGLFSVAEKLNKKAATLLTISDNLITHEYTTSEERQNSFNDMMKLALSLAKDFQ